MQPQARLSDRSLVPADSHGCPKCPHTAIGPAVIGSPDVFVNDLPAVRVTDMGVHSACCGANIWIASKGSDSVLINNLPTHRRFDEDIHCGGKGFMLEGSTNVYVGECTETSLGIAVDTTQATVVVPEQVQVIPVPLTQVVPMQIPQANVVVPSFVNGVPVDPDTMQPLADGPTGGI